MHARGEERGLVFAGPAVVEGKDGQGWDGPLGARQSVAPERIDRGPEGERHAGEQKDARDGQQLQSGDSLATPFPVVPGENQDHG